MFKILIFGVFSLKVIASFDIILRQWNALLTEVVVVGDDPCIPGIPLSNAFQERYFPLNFFSIEEVRLFVFFRIINFVEHDCVIGYPVELLAIRMLILVFDLLRRLGIRRSIRIIPRILVFQPSIVARNNHSSPF